MKTELNTLDQAHIQTLIRGRLEHPELYADKPLFIWQAAWHDGIQQELAIQTSVEINKGRARDDRSYFRLITVREGDNRLNNPDRKEMGRLSGYVINTRTLNPESYLREVGKLIEENNNTMPLIVYLPFRYEQSLGVETCLEAEHYIFEPDFETWAETAADSTIPDFIRGDGDKTGIAYRWYNLFNDADKGCSTPLVWLAVGFNLNGLISSAGKFRTNQSIGDLDVDLIRSAIQFGVKASKGHLSDDVIDDFMKYLKNKA